MLDSESLSLASGYWTLSNATMCRVQKLKVCAFYVHIWCALQTVWLDQTRRTHTRSSQKGMDLNRSDQYGSKELDSDRSGPKELDLNRPGRTLSDNFSRIGDQNSREVAPCMSAAQKSIGCSIQVQNFKPRHSDELSCLDAHFVWSIHLIQVCNHFFPRRGYCMLNCFGSGYWILVSNPLGTLDIGFKSSQDIGY